MKHLKIFTKQDLRQLTKLRNGEVKFGEKINIVTSDNLEESIKASTSKFVIFGIEEDFGVRANLGNPGAKDTWSTFLPFFLNIQHNKFCSGQDFFLLGSLNYDEIYSKTNFEENTDREKLFELVSMVDKDVSHLVYMIKKYAKIPIVIGGGHNNSYGIIKGCALAIRKPINVLNIDAHSDFRIMEGRHSGNGFTYAYDEKFLKKYLILGLHESYISKNLIIELKDKKEFIKYVTLEDILNKPHLNPKKLINTVIDFFPEEETFGLEIDLDAIENIPSSAITPSGFSLNGIRKIIFDCSSYKKIEYLHVCEGISTENHLQNALLTKSIIYLITDFVKYYKLDD